MRPLADYVSVKDPGLVSYNIDFTYYVPTDTTLSPGAAIQEAVDAAVEEYIALAVRQALGRDINSAAGDLLSSTLTVLRLPGLQGAGGRQKNNAAPQIAKLGNEKQS